MKKIISILGLIVFLIGGMLLGASYAAYQATYTLEFEASNVSEDFDLYILLPKDYIEFAIKDDALDIEYTGVDTLKNNDIPSIRVNKENVSDELYEEDGVEYVQILLEENDDGIYEFDILSNYKEMDMKYRIKNVNKDFIVHIDNFKIDDGVCKIEYNYEEDTVKQPDTQFIPFVTKLLLVILVVIILIGLIAYIKQRR